MNIHENLLVKIAGYAFVLAPGRRLKMRTRASVESEERDKKCKMRAIEK